MSRTAVTNIWSRHSNPLIGGGPGLCDGLWRLSGVQGGTPMMSTTSVTVLMAAWVSVGLQTTVENPTVTGVWSVTLMSHQQGLELVQEGAAVTGTLHIRGTPVAMEGTFQDGDLAIRAVGAKLKGPDGGEPVELRLTGRLMPDGSLDGQATTPRGAERWTAERLKRYR